MTTHESHSQHQQCPGALIGQKGFKVRIPVAGVLLDQGVIEGFIRDRTETVGVDGQWAGRIVTHSTGKY